MGSSSRVFLAPSWPGVSSSQQVSRFPLCSGLHLEPNRPEGRRSIHSLHHLRPRCRIQFASRRRGPPGSQTEPPCVAFWGGRTGRGDGEGDGCGGRSQEFVVSGQGTFSIWGIWTPVKLCSISKSVADVAVAYFAIMIWRILGSQVFPSGEGNLPSQLE